MKAIVITTPGAADVLQLEERPVPEVSPNEVLIKVKAAGVNRPDVSQRKGNYPAPEGASADIPGLEVAGIIVQLGEKVQGWEKGDAVCALVAGGGYAEFVNADYRHCLAVPANLNFAEAASLPETVLTVWHNVFQRGQLKRGENFLVHGGSSGIGITAIQIAAAFGARVFATAGSLEKCTVCESLGADICIDYKKEDFEVVLKDEGVDVILDMIGGEYIPQNLRLLKPEGRLVFINAVNGYVTTIDVGELMQRRLTITGSTLRSRDPEFKAELVTEVRKNVWPLIAEGTFQPVIYKMLPLDKAAEAHKIMESSTHIGKIVLIVDE